jgi:hypothetical protein
LGKLGCARAVETVIPVFSAKISITPYHQFCSLKAPLGISHTTRMNQMILRLDQEGPEESLPGCNIPNISAMRTYNKQDDIPHFSPWGNTPVFGGYVANMQ